MRVEVDRRRFLKLAGMAAGGVAIAEALGPLAPQHAAGAGDSTAHSQSPTPLARGNAQHTRLVQVQKAGGEKA